MNFCTFSSFFTTILIALIFEPLCSNGANTTRCGTSWVDANSKCGVTCTNGIDSACLQYNETCYNDLSISPCNDEDEDSEDDDDSILTNYTIPTIHSCGTKHVISLTFDDGPIWYDSVNNNATITIIQKLSSLNIPATFYISPARNGDSEELLNTKCKLIKLLTENNFEIESHSWWHTDFTDPELSLSEMINELVMVEEFILDCGGKLPRIFRPPYGELNLNQAYYIANKLNYTIGFWNVDSFDWNTPNNASAIISTITNRINDDFENFDYSINLLMHDISSFEVIEQIVDFFQTDSQFSDYEFITQSECYEECDTIDKYGICRDPTGIDLYTIDEWDSDQVDLTYYDDDNSLDDDDDDDDDSGTDSQMTQFSIKLLFLITVQGWLIF